MAFQTFMKISGIPGESKDEKHQGWIEVLAVAWGVKKPTRSTPGETARMFAEDFTLIKAMDISSALLLQSLCSNKLLPQVNFEFCRAGGDKMKYMEWEFTNCHVTNYKMDSIESSKVGETLPTEEFSFNYEKFKITYSQQKRADGSSAGTVVAGWDLKTNAPS